MEGEYSNIVEEVEAYVSASLAEGLRDELAFHDLFHTREVVSAAREIGMGINLSPADLEMVVLAAWFHDVGYLHSYDDHELESQKVASNFLKQKGYPADKLQRIVELIGVTRISAVPQDDLEAVIADADMYHLSLPDWIEKSNNLRMEWQMIRGESFTDIEWMEQNLKFFRDHSYCTEYSRLVLAPRKAANQKKLKKSFKKALENLQKELSGQIKQVKKLEKKVDKLKKERDLRPDRGIETMFRTTSRNHLDFSSIADNKANIMISINAIIISIAMTVLVSNFEQNPRLILPTILLLVVCMTTIIFSILATRPKVTSGMFTRDEIEKKRVNLLFFGNFYRTSLEDYEWGMREMMADSEYLYGSMIKDIYYHGKILAAKFNLLRVSYNVFMFGLVASMIAYLAAFIFF